MGTMEEQKFQSFLVNTFSEGLREWSRVEEEAQCCFFGGALSSLVCYTHGADWLVQEVVPP